MTPAAAVGGTALAFEAVAEVVERRAATYRLLGELLAPPTPALAERLADGSLAAELRAAVGWLGAEADWFAEPADALDGRAVLPAQRAPRARPTPGAGALAVEHRRLFGAETGEVGDITVVTDELSRLAGLCDGEAAAWRAEDPTAATGHRHHAQDRLARTLATWADEVADLVAAAASLPTYPAAAETLRRFVDAELGRGLDRSRFPWRDRRRTSDAG